MGDIDRRRLDEAIERGLDAVWRRQRSDGAIDGTNHGGPLYAGIALAARAQIGALDEADRGAVTEWMKSTQLADGSYPSSPCATKGSLDATAAAYAGLTAAGVGADDPAQGRARAFIDAHGGLTSVNPMYFPTLAVTGLLPASALPAPHLFVQLVPFFQTVMGRRFNQWIGMSADIMPLITRGLLDHGEKVSWLVHPLRRLEEEHVLSFLEDVQNPSGSLSGVLLYTAQLVSTLALMGVDEDDPHFVRAKTALGSFRVENDRGMEYLPFTAEIWNTAEAVRASVRAGRDPDAPPIRAAIDWLLSKQTRVDAPESWQNPRPGAPRQGGWPFEATNVQNPDCDTTGAVLHALAEVRRRSDRTDVRDAMQDGLEWLLPMQNDDGGWPSMTRDVGKKPPGPLFERPFRPPTTMAEMLATAIHPPLELQDPSTAAMTGRIARGIAACGVTKHDPTLRAAAEFMRQQQWHDRWWGRWEVNYLAGTAFGLIGLAGTDVDVSSPWVQRAASFLTGRQNVDGGFGESTETYVDWKAEGPWPSRADLTGKVLMGLIDAGRADESVTRAVRYLIDAQGPSGDYRTDDGEYVILPPDLFYTNPTCNQIDAVEGLVYYRETRS